uniref:Uncharacterized protein n=1 Tax=Compsopogon caeruleus TaxID=31354 RepID=A0A7S1T701_9RHOD
MMETIQFLANGRGSNLLKLAASPRSLTPTVPLSELLQSSEDFSSFASWPGQATDGIAERISSLNPTRCATIYSTQHRGPDSEDPILRSLQYCWYTPTAINANRLPNLTYLESSPTQTYEFSSKAVASLRGMHGLEEDALVIEAQEFYRALVDSTATC